MSSSSLGSRIGAGLFSFLFTACVGKVERPDGGQGMLSAGADVPTLQANDHLGKEINLRKNEYKATVVYFYPKDGTPGCTKEACAFRDVWEKYQEAGIQLIGVSSDTRESHETFAKEHSLPFSLVADPDLKWTKAFGVKTMFGLTQRVSFLLSPAGKVVKNYPDVDPGVHADEILNDAKALKLTSQ